MPTITVTNATRVVWSGSYRDFQLANIEALSVAEWLELWNQGALQVGGGSAPAFTIWLHYPSDTPNCRPINP